MEYLWHLTDLTYSVVPNLATRQQQQQQEEGNEGSSKMDTGSTTTAQQQQHGLKRKHEDNGCGSGGNSNNEEEDFWRPPKRVSPFLNTPKQRRDEKRKLLRTSINKLRDIENAEVCLHRAVLLHNTVRKLQKQLQEEKRSVTTMRHGAAPYRVSDGRSYLAANAHLFVDHFMYADMEQIVDNSDLLDRMIGSLQTDAETKITKMDNAAVVSKPVDLSGKDMMYVDENCNQNQYIQAQMGGQNGQSAYDDMLLGACPSMSNGAQTSTVGGGVPCDFMSSLQHHLYTQSLTPPPHVSQTISDVEDRMRGDEQATDSAVLDMRIKDQSDAERKEDVMVETSSLSSSSSLDQIMSTSSSSSSSSSCVDTSPGTPPLTLSGSIAHAMNCVTGGGIGEDLVRPVIASSSSPQPPSSSSSPEPTTCLAGHTGYFSVISGPEGDNATAAATHPPPPYTQHTQETVTSEPPPLPSSSLSLSSSSTTSHVTSSYTATTLTPTLPPMMMMTTHNITSSSPTPTLPPPSSSPQLLQQHHHSTCSEAFQRERSASPANLSPFLALLDEPWSLADTNGVGSGAGATGGGSGHVVDKSGAVTATDLDTVLGSLIGVLTGTC